MQIKYPDGEILKCNGNNEVGINLEIDSGVEYKLKITSNNGYEKEVSIYEEKSQIPPKTVMNHWNLGVEHDELKIYQGTPIYNGLEEGVYLENSIIATKDNYKLNIPYTVIIETKNIQNNGWGFILAKGQRRLICGISVLGNL